jgi:hypothetical protein
MIFKSPAVAAALFCLALAPVAHAAQMGHQAAPPHQAAPTAPAPAAPAPAPPTASGTSAPATADSPGGASEYQQPHITIATPAPAPAPWPLQDRIAWIANLLLVLIAYVAIMLALSTLRKIERQTRYAETAAQAAADSAKAALLFAETQAQTQAQIDRPWLLVASEPAPGVPDSFNIMATNRGRTPARIVSLAEEIVIAKGESQLPAAPVYNSEPRAPRVPIILLPGESTAIKSFSRDEMRSICESPEQLRRVEEWEEKIYLYGAITYADLRAPAEEPARETSWCCWYIHGRQKSGMVIAGPPAYNRHT